MELNLNGGDLLLRVSLFWCIFLPLGSRYSVDAASKFEDKSKKRIINEEEEKKKKRTCGIITVGWIIQFSSMYIFSYGLKSGASWWEGTAVALALQQEQFLTRSGHLLRSFIFPPNFFPSTLYPQVFWMYVSFLPPTLFILSLFPLLYISVFNSETRMTQSSIFYAFFNVGA